MEKIELKNPPRLHRLRLLLLNTDPVVWRTIEAPLEIQLDHLHRAIKEAMGWEIEANGQNDKEYSFTRGEQNVSDPESTTLKEVLGHGGRRLTYLYDGSLNHDIWVEQPVEAENGGFYPRLVDGENIYRSEESDKVMDDFDASPRLLAAKRFQWPEDAPVADDESTRKWGNIAHSIQQKVSTLRESLVDEENPDAEAAEILDTLDAQIEDLPWAIHELLNSTDGLSAAAIDIFIDIIDLNVGLEEVLLPLIRNEALRRGDSPAAVNTATLLGDLRYEPAVEPLVETIVDLDSRDDFLCRTAAVSLTRIGEPAVDTIIDTIHAIPASEGRLALFAALSYMEFEDERIEECLISALEEAHRLDKPEKRDIAYFLSVYGGENAQQALLNAFDQQTQRALSSESVLPGTDQNAEAAGAALFLYQILGSTGWQPDPKRQNQVVQLEDLIQSYSKAMEKSSTTAPVKPHRAEDLPGRNDPCWCGSGKKYKKCHLRTDRN